MVKHSEFVMVCNNRQRSEKYTGTTPIEHAVLAFKSCSRLRVQKDTLFKAQNNGIVYPV